MTDKNEKHEANIKNGHLDGHSDELNTYSDVTRLLHTGQDPGQWNCKAIVPPVVNSTTFAQDQPGQAVYEYSRSANPTRDCLEASLAVSEHARFGLAFSSGLGATTAVCFLLRAGDHILASSDLYGGTNRLFSKCMNRMNMKVTLADSTSDVESFLALIRKGKTKMVWIETPTNPLMNVTDIGAVASRCKRDNIILVVDNTFATPIFQKPLEHGADLVVHSATKYLNGHSDVVMGCAMMNREDIYSNAFSAYLTFKGTTSLQDLITLEESLFVNSTGLLYRELKFLQNSLGIVPSPSDCFLVNRGLKTLHIRMREHMENAKKVAKFLESFNKEVVEKMKGCSGMVSFVIKARNKEQIVQFTSALKVFTLAESLGGYESLVCVPALMTHASVDTKHRKLIGLTDNLIRLSVGLEDAGDLCRDLEQALQHMIRS